LKVQPLLDDAALARLCARVLEHMSIGVLACDDDMVVLNATPTARVLMIDFLGGDPILIGARLPGPILDAAQQFIEESDSNHRRIAPVRVETGESSSGALFVASRRIDGLSPATVAVRLHKERLCDAELFEALRQRVHLSARDRRLIVLLRQRFSNADIAETLHLTVGTVKVYVHEVFEKLGVHSRSELVAFLDRVRRS
jgi:DNA-binding CsgD family transcriptional regulator